MTKDEIVALAKQAGGTPYTNRFTQGETAMAFGPAALIVFAELINARIQIPEGYQLMPIEPTNEIRKAFEAAWSEAHSKHLNCSVHCYRAMIAAGAMKETP